MWLVKSITYSLFTYMRDTCVLDQINTKLKFSLRQTINLKDFISYYTQLGNFLDSLTDLNQSTQD